MNSKANDHFQLKLISVAILAGASLVGLEARPEDFEDTAICEQVEQVKHSVLPQALGNELEIISWNIQKTNNRNWRQDLANLSDNASLIFIQEAVHGAAITSAIPTERHPEFAPGYRRGNLQTGVMTLSASSPAATCDLSINEPWLRTPKATSVAQYRLSDRDENLLVINLHAINFALGLSSYNRQFAALGDHLENHSGPVILAGDLNTWSKKRQKMVDNFMAQHDMNPVAFNPDYRSRVFGKALDHIYVRGLEARSAEAIRVDSSDHNPLRVRLRLL